MPNWKKVIISGSNATLNNITASGHVNATTYYGDGSNLTGISGGGGSTFPYTGSAIISGSLSLEGSGSTIFDIVGSQGQLFSITDSLSGSLFAVSDISGLPILEVFSDDTVKIGSFNDEAITVSGSHTTIGGVLAIPGFSDVSASLAEASGSGGGGTFNYARAIMSSDVLKGGANQQEFTSPTSQKVKFDTNSDTEGTDITIDTTNNRITVAATGYYELTSNISFNATAQRTTPTSLFKKNGTTDLLGEGYGYIRRTTGQDDNNNLITCIVQLQANDYIEVWCSDTSTAGGVVYATQAFFEISDTGAGHTGPTGPTGIQGPSGTSYDAVEITSDTTLSSTHTTKYLVCNSSSPIDLTIPASATYDTYAEFVMEQRGTGTVTIVPAVGVTLNSSETLKTAKQYSVIGLKRTDTNVYTLTGEREATP